MRRARPGRPSGRRDERGAILVMAVPGLVLALVAMSLSVDLGRQVLDKRRDQAVADAAALDAARRLADHQGAAVASAARNGFGDASKVVAERGRVDAGGFQVDPTGDAVRVSVSSSVDYIFAPGRKDLKASAVARAGAQAGFYLGSTLASVDTGKAALLNRVLGSMLKGTAAGGGNADILGWQGLANSQVSLASLWGEMELLEAGVQFATLDQLLQSDVTVAQVAQATANALTRKGDLAGASLYGGGAGIVSQATSTATFKLGRLIQVEQGAGPAALAGQVNAFQLLTATALLANGTNAIAIPGATANVVGVSSATLVLGVVEGPKWVFGAKGVLGTTAQATATLTPTVDLPVAGLATITGDLPIAVSLAGATGTLADIRCPTAAAGPGIDVRVALTPASGSTAATLQSTSLAGVTTSFSVAGSVLATGATTQTLGFAHPQEFTPTAAGKRVSASPVDWTASLTQTGGVAGLASAVGTMTTSLGTDVLAPVLNGFGLGVGVVDVTADKTAFTEGCKAAPRLVQ